MMTYHPIKFCCNWISSSGDMAETVISDQMSPHCNAELKTATQSSCITRWPMMQYHNTKFGYRRFSS